MDKNKVLDLARLARIELRDEEAESLSHDLNAILDYFREIKKLDHKSSLTEVLPRQGDFAVVNIMRPDNEPHQSGIYTERLLSEAPAREDNCIKVKKIL